MGKNLSCISSRRLAARYGVQVLEWDGAVIEAEVGRDFGVQMPRITYDQLMAGLAALGTDQVYWDVGVFDQIVNGLKRAEGLDTFDYDTRFSPFIAEM